MPNLKAIPEKFKLVVTTSMKNVSGFSFPVSQLKNPSVRFFIIMKEVLYKELKVFPWN